jgi:hypothetical protein
MKVIDYLYLVQFRSNGMDRQQHEMVLEKTYSSGVDEWYCPTCGRRLLMEYTPEFKKTVLEVGDEYAAHSGGKGGVRMQTPQIISSKEEGELEKDPHLSVWTDWMDKRNFDEW